MPSGFPAAVHFSRVIFAQLAWISHRLDKLVIHPYGTLFIAIAEFKLCTSLRDPTGRKLSDKRLSFDRILGVPGRVSPHSV